MPLGYSAPKIVAHGFGALRDVELRQYNFDKCRDAPLVKSSRKLRFLTGKASSAPLAG